MTTRNDITGDAIKSRASTKEFRDNFARIKFGVNRGIIIPDTASSEEGTVANSYPSQQLPTK